MKLYYNPLSTYSQKAMIAFNEKGIAYEPVIVNLQTPEGIAAYEKISPLGKIPFLKSGDDWQVPESTSIIEYLDDKFPDTPPLIPQGDREAARQVRFMDRMSDLYYNDPVIELIFQQVGFRANDEQKATRARKYVETTYAHWDKRLASQSWMCGEQFSMADCSAIPAMYHAQTVAPFADYSNVAAYWERTQKRPSYAKVRSEFEPIWNGMLAQTSAAA